MAQRVLGLASYMAGMGFGLSHEDVMVLAFEIPENSILLKWSS